LRRRVRKTTDRGKRSEARALHHPVVVARIDEKTPKLRQDPLVELMKGRPEQSPLQTDRTAPALYFHHVEVTMKNLLCLGLALATLFVFAFTASADDATAKGKAKKAPAVRGVIADVKADKDKDAGEITLTIQKKTKKGEKAAEPEKKTIKIPEGTKIELVSGKKGAQTTKAGSFKDLQTGERVSVTLEGDSAKEIKIHVKAKK
jgi:hypothetical protein